MSHVRLPAFCLLPVTDPHPDLIKRCKIIIYTILPQCQFYIIFLHFIISFKEEKFHYWVFSRTRWKPAPLHPTMNELSNAFDNLILTSFHFTVKYTINYSELYCPLLLESTDFKNLNSQCVANPVIYRYGNFWCLSNYVNNGCDIIIGVFRFQNKQIGSEGPFNY